MYSNTEFLGDLGKIKLSAAQVQAVRDARANAAVAKKIAAANAKASKVQYRADLANARRAVKLAKVNAKMPVAESPLTQTSSAAADLMALAPTPAQAAQYAGGGGGGGGIPMAQPTDVAPDAPPAESSLMTYLPYAAGAGLLLLLLRKKR